MQNLQRWAAHLCDFYPRSPCGERLANFRPPARPCCFQFLSTLSLRRATCGAVWGRCAPQISIHALLAESDCFCLCHLPAPGNFYPRSPCGERLSSWTFTNFHEPIFLSTLSLRRATRSAPEQLRTVRVFLSTLSLRRATADEFYVAALTNISIHALLAESDLRAEGPKKARYKFLSTLSLRRATANPDAQADRPPPFLSTLSLRRATFSLALYSPLPANFYPRSPCGERRLMELHFSDECGRMISIHALLAESDKQLL